MPPCPSAPRCPWRPCKPRCFPGMFDEHLNRQHRLSYIARGPEWAFAIPQGDLETLESVMRRCSTFWNGVGTVLVPVRADGRIPVSVKWFLRIRPVDACYTHERLGEAAREAVQRLTGAVPMWEGFDRRELGPADLLGRREAVSARLMERPRFGTAGLRRAALAIWGHIPEEDAAYWEDRYEVVFRQGEHAHGALLRGQVQRQAASPLRFTSLYMQAAHQVAPLDRPYIWVIESPTFDNLVNFWNFRARCLAQANGAPVIGIPRESLRHPGELCELTTWVVRYPSVRRTPDVLVSRPSELDDELRAVLLALPFVEDTGDGIEEQWGLSPAPNEPPSFRFVRPRLGGPFIRGTSGNTLVVFANGRSSLALPAPQSFKARSFGHTRLVFRNLPLPLPMTPTVARAVHRDGQASDGVMLLTNAPERWNFDIRLPTAEEALAHWLGDHGFGFERTQDGHDADALLTRLGSLDALDVLADPKRVAVLDSLAPPNRDKLAAALVAEAKEEAGVELDANALVEKLSDLGLFLEVETRTAGDIASVMGPGIASVTRSASCRP